MLALHEQIFDEVLTGTTMSWTTPEQHNPLFGVAATSVIFAVATGVTVGSGNLGLDIYFDESGDNQHWGLGTTSFITVSGTTDLVAAKATPNAGLQLPFGRLRIEQTGDTPQCRLKLYLTARGF